MQNYDPTCIVCNYVFVAEEGDMCDQCKEYFGSYEEFEKMRKVSVNDKQE